MNFIKKAMSSSLAVVIAISGITTTANAITQDFGNITPYRFATDFLTEYYTAIDLYETYDFDNYIDSSNLLEYVNGKVESKRYKSIVYETDDMQNYELSFTLKNSEISDSYTKLTILAEAKFNYKYADFDSAYGEVSQIIISNDTGYSIEDWYVPSDSYDMQLRGDSIIIDNPNFWNNVTRSSNDLHQKQQDLNYKIKQFYNEMITPAENPTESFNSQMNK